MTTKSVTVYSDGSCLGNPGPGGWAAVLLYQGHRREISGGFSLTTNNRMEMMALIKALQSLKHPCHVEAHTDSLYLHHAFSKGWLKSWLKNGWRTAAKKPVKNKDLWLELIPLMERHEVRFHWVKGHSGDPENERCDQLAKQAALTPGLPQDPGYPE